MGDRAWNQNASITLHVGPLSMTQFLDLIPSGCRHGELAELLNFYLGPQIACLVELELEHLPDQADPIYELGHPQQMLGYTVWLDSSADGDVGLDPTHQFARAVDARLCRFWMNEVTWRGPRGATADALEPIEKKS
jgi:predicted component of type VI protein secretion system